MTVSGWDAVVGQRAAARILRQALTRDEVAHAWLMSGPAGVGQTALVRAIAMALNCPQPTQTDAGCSSCDTCKRIARGVHPALVELEPEGAFHVVDAVRGDWIPTATRSLTEGRRRIMYVASADRMNIAAQNAFLKILEEPPASVVWILDVQDEGMLLDTVASRCRKLALVPWGPDDLAQFASQLEVADEHIDTIVRAALGSPQRLRDLADPDVAVARLRNLEIIERLAVNGPGDVVPVAKELAAWAKSRAEVLKERHRTEMERLEESFGVDNGRGWPAGIKSRLTKRFERLERQERRRALDMILDDIGSWLRDLLLVQSSTLETSIVNIDRLDELRRDAPRLTPGDLVQCLQAVATCRDALDKNGNPDLQLERLLLSLALPIYARRAAA
ncbi:MAG: DNA polymerase III subunit delta' C-terminal domain-containing protein [Nitriliruptoraceae bacterium]